MDEPKPILTPLATDRLAATARAVAGAVPVFGGAIAEIITAIIPNQRFDRVIDFLQALDEKLCRLDRETVEARLRTEEFIELLEEGAQQAARALTAERRRLLAAFLSHSLTDDELEHVYKRRLLQILAELNEAQIIILQSYQPRLDQKEFRSKHYREIWGPTSQRRSKRDRDRAALHKSFHRHLADLGLIARQMKLPAALKSPPQIDEDTGIPKESYYKLTPLGAIVIRYLDKDFEDEIA